MAQRIDIFEQMIVPIFTCCTKRFVLRSIYRRAGQYALFDLWRFHMYMSIVPAVGLPNKKRSFCLTTIHYDLVFRAI